MAILFDERGNPYTGAIDLITGHTFTDTRPLSVLLASVNAEAVMELNGQSSVTVDVRSAAFVGTLVFEGSTDGVNYFSLIAINLVTQAAIFAPALSGAIANLFQVHVGGFALFRVRVSAFTSGNLDVSLRGSFAHPRQSDNRPYPTTLWVTATAAANAIATATLAAPGAGLFHYITHISIYRNTTLAVVGSATLIHTTTNLPGSPAWSVGNAIDIGRAEKDVEITFPNPLKCSAANTATTVVAPAAGAGVLNRVNVGYFIAA